jgi:site-specific recombinase XerD
MTLKRQSTPSHDLVRVTPNALPRLVRSAGDRASRRFAEFFAATIRNKNTRLAYAQAIGQFFRWCDSRGFRSLDEIEPLVIAAYIEQHPGAKPTVKQHLAAIRMLFDWCHRAPKTGQ